MEEEKKEGSKAENKFTNDGSFLEMFKKQMAEKNNTQKTDVIKSEVAATSATNTKTQVSESTEAQSQNKTRLKSGTLPLIGKRRGNNMNLKTGTVKKKKEDDNEESNETDAWSKYMAEVKKYKGSVCQEEDKTRPLVK